MRGLYIHIPFCLRKCPYCDFNSYAGAQRYENEYFAALQKEAADFAGESIDTVYIGGGTPSITKAYNICGFIDFLRGNFNISPNAEITIEANPATLTADKLKAYRAAGINRISIGVQSLHDDILKTLGRLHNSAEAAEAVMLAAECGFKNISCDFMFALPGQTAEMLTADLKQALRLPTTHISCYGLKVEKGTPFYESGIQPAEDEEYEKMYASATEVLESAGFNRYEISNFARAGAQSRHNLKYWHCEEYIGLGAGAHSYVNGIRYSNVCSIEKYINGGGHENIETLTEHDRFVENLIMGMRLSGGVRETVVQNLGNGERLEYFIKTGFVQRKGNNIAFTQKGINVSNYILSELI